MNGRYLFAAMLLIAIALGTHAHRTMIRVHMESGDNQTTPLALAISGANHSLSAQLATANHTVIVAADAPSDSQPAARDDLAADRDHRESLLIPSLLTVPPEMYVETQAIGVSAHTGTSVPHPAFSYPVEQMIAGAGGLQEYLLIPIGNSLIESFRIGELPAFIFLVEFCDASTVWSASTCGPLEFAIDSNDSLQLHLIHAKESGHWGFNKHIDGFVQKEDYQAIRNSTMLLLLMDLKTIYSDRPRTRTRSAFD